MSATPIYIQNLVPKSVFDEYHEKSFSFVDTRLFALLQLLAQAFGTKYVVNTWNYTEAEIDAMNEEYGTQYDFNNPVEDRGYIIPVENNDDVPVIMHMQGKGVEFQLLGVMSADVVNEILTNYGKYRIWGLTGVNTTSPDLTYIDTRAENVEGQAMKPVIQPFNTTLQVDTSIGSLGTFSITVDGQIDINFGDGTILTGQTGTITHSYGATKKYLVTIYNATNNTSFAINTSNCTYINHINFIEGLQTLRITEQTIALIDLTGCQALTNIVLASNEIWKIDISKNTILESIDMDSNSLSELNIATNQLITNINVQRNVLKTINSILANLVAAGKTGGTALLNLQTPLCPPTGQGIIDKATLISRGWTVTTD
jgi:hypothetical protein